jgi:hypothetical protein
MLRVMLGCKPLAGVRDYLFMESIARPCKNMNPKN